MLAAVADAVTPTGADQVLRVGVDGVDGAGKTVFADEFAAELARRGMAALRASADGFHHPPAVRYRRGRSSPEGFFLDSYDYDSFIRLLLAPLAPGGDRRIVRAIYDVRAERPVPQVAQVAPVPGVLIVDDIFLHRPELRRHWDYSVFLQVDFTLSVARQARRDGTDPDPAAPANHRYIQGQRIYLRTCQPQRHASVVIDNTDLDGATITQRRSLVAASIVGSVVIGESDIAG
jgi:uridine kinase